MLLRSSQGCTTCPAGTYSTPGSQYCTPCPANMHSSAGASQCYFCGAGRPSCPDNVSIALCPGIGYGQQWSVFSDEWGSEGSYSCLLENDDAPENWMSWGLSVLWCPQQNSAAHLLTTASRSMPVLSIAQGRAIDPENTSVVSYALSLAPWAIPGRGNTVYHTKSYNFKSSLIVDITIAGPVADDGHVSRAPVRPEQAASIPRLGIVGGKGDHLRSRRRRPAFKHCAQWHGVRDRGSVLPARVLLSHWL